MNKENKIVNFSKTKSTYENLNQGITASKTLGKVKKHIRKKGMVYTIHITDDARKMEVQTQ